ncbi:hypothetical protein ACN28S_28695 [Cystobacter fuscus]
MSPVKLPIQSISYFSLAETMTGSNDQQRIGVALFRSMKGSGDGSSGTYNFDLTLDGAEKFSSAPPPIVVPVGLKAQLTVRPPALKARLSCDFTTGWSVQGRTDIKDGLIIFNDDIYTSMVAKSVAETNKPCRVHVEGVMAARRSSSTRNPWWRCKSASRTCTSSASPSPITRS